MYAKSIIVVSLAVLIAALAHGMDSSATVPEGYAGPGWNVRLAGDASGMDSLGPIMFRLADTLFMGPTIAYSESSSEAPSRVLGGLRAEWYPRPLAGSWYATSLGVTAAAGVIDAAVSGRPIASVALDLAATHNRPGDVRLDSGRRA